jgi:hypothetical protein
MNAAVQKLQALGAALAIGGGVGWHARADREAGIPSSAVVVSPPQETVPSPELIFAPETEDEIPEIPQFFPFEAPGDPTAAMWWQRKRHRFDPDLIRVE